MWGGLQLSLTVHPGQYWLCCGELGKGHRAGAKAGGLEGRPVNAGCQLARPESHAPVPDNWGELGKATSHARIRQLPALGTELCQVWGLLLTTLAIGPFKNHFIINIIFPFSQVSVMYKECR